MIHKPPIDELAQKIGSKYELCVVTSKRARQLMEQAQNQGYTELPNKEKPLKSFLVARKRGNSFPLQAMLPTFRPMKMQ